MVSSYSWVVCPGVSRKVIDSHRKLSSFSMLLDLTPVCVHQLAVTGTARADQVREYFESKYGPVKEVVSFRTQI